MMIRRIFLVLCSLLAVNAAQAAGIVFTFGNNVTAERQAALQAAANELQQIIHFRQNITIKVSFDNLQCTSNSGVLGSAGPRSAYANFAEALQANTWYVSAQAADLGFATAKAASPHIAGQFNNQLGNTGCLDGITWYFGTDHKPGLNQVDFLATAVHEFMHGLGFISFVSSTGALSGGQIDNFSTFLQDASSGKSWKNMTDGERAASILNNGNLVWNGAKTTAMDSLLSAGKTSGKVRLYAPSSYESGSSTSHFDISVHYNDNSDEVMEPYDAFPQSSIMASAAFCDMGWTLLRDTDGDGINDCDDADPLVAALDTDGDGVSDAQDAFPDNAAAAVDSDGDGLPDSWLPGNPYGCVPTAPTCNGLTLDSDDDNDGVPNATDNCPQVSNPAQLDYNNNGVGDACGDPLPMPSQTSGVSKDNTGSAVAFAGDFDNDGYGDYVIGVPHHDVSGAALLKDAGEAMVISGKSGLALKLIEGVAARDGMGAAVAGAGDVDGDGYTDVLVGAPKADDVAHGLVDAGSVTLLYGPDGARSATFYGDRAKALFGSALALGDTNHDGTADLIIGAPKDDDVANGLADAGSVTVISGSTLLVAQKFYGKTAKAYAGSSVACGEIDVVTGVDIIVGAPGDDGIGNGLPDTGSVTVYNIDGTEIMKKSGVTAKAALGASVAAGDVNHDGRDDVIAGAPKDDDFTNFFKDTGSITVYSGNDGAVLHTVYGNRPKARLGSSVAAGDVNGDGYVDIIGGAPKDDSSGSVRDAGSVSVWSGNGFAAMATLYGGAAKDYLGFAVSSGDINGDGKADIIAGATGDDIPGAVLVKDAGSVRLFSGADL